MANMATIWIKMCGITCVEDAAQAARLGADAIGLNFYPPSPRHVSIRLAGDIVAALPESTEPVALFVNQAPDTIAEALDDLPRVRTVQWHGEEPPLCLTTPYRYIPAFGVRDPGDLTAVKQYVAHCRASACLLSAILLDSRRPELYGGTGQPAPWSLLADFDPGVPIILAGGLTPENVAEAIRVVRPYAVDVASGVESSPGRKDAELMRRFIDRAREAAADL